MQNILQVTKYVDPKPEPTLQIFEGQVFGWFETGLEGVVWALQTFETQNYDGLIVVEKGDHLILRSQAGEVLFDGIIDPDYEIGTQSRFPGDTSGQSIALGHWIHWTQRSWLPDNWASFFISGENTGRIERKQPCD